MQETVQRGIILFLLEILVVTKLKANIFPDGHYRENFEIPPAITLTILY